jgi:hypothetical protein
MTTQDKIEEITKNLLKRCKDRIDHGEKLKQEPTLYSLKRKWL